MAEKGDFFFNAKRLSPNAILPSRASSLFVVYDLYSVAEIKVPARGNALVPTDLSIAIPGDSYAQIASRSGLAWKHMIKVGGGVIDADYRGPIGVILFNHSNLDFEVKPGDLIAHLIIKKIITPDAELDNLDSTIRGSGGFGSDMVENGDFYEPSPKIPKLFGETPIGHAFLKVKKLSPNAILPSRASSLSAGYDLYSTAQIKVPARGKALIPTDLSIVIPGDTYGRIAPRSGLALKHLIDVGGGVIAANYRGHLRVILFNHSNLDFEVKPGDRIAQLIIEKIIPPNVANLNDLDSIVCGSGGFESTDMAENGEFHESSPKIPKLSGEIPTGLSLLKVKNLSPNAVLPSRASSLSAGYDLFSVANIKVPARGKALVPIDLSIDIPGDTYAQVAPTSELAWKHSIDVGADVIDVDNRGAISVILFNFSDLDFEVKSGDCIAHLIIQKIITQDVGELNDLDSTVRGSGGFGSTGA